jgi:hypothetical protein
MASLPAAGAVIRIRHLFDTGGPQPIGVHCYQAYTGSAPDSAQLIALATAVYPHMTADLDSLATTGLNFAGVQCNDLSVSPSSVGEFDFVTAGARAGAIPTIDTCLTTRWVIARAYRGGKPKSFWPFGIVADLANPSTWDSTITGDFLTQWAIYQGHLNGLTAGGVTLQEQVSVSYFKGLTARIKPSTGRTYYVGTPRAVPLVEPVIGVIPDTRIGSQRRRRVG